MMRVASCAFDCAESVDLARWYWRTVYRFDVPCFSGQQHDEMATEILSNEILQQRISTKDTTYSLFMRRFRNIIIDLAGGNMNNNAVYFK